MSSEGQEFVGVPDDRLDGRVALVTGAGRGIGAAVARQLARAGASTVLASRNLEQLEGVRASLPDASRGLAVPTDVSQADDLDRLVERAMETFGGIDILVNNAGAIPPAKQIYKYAPDEWEYIMAVNLKAVWHLSNQVRTHMKARGGGAIVNISSNAALHHDIGLGLYGISKAAVVMLSTVQAKEWARDKIRVNCLVPGVVRTELAKDVIAYLAEHDTKPNPLDFIAEPDDIASLVHFLVSDRSRYMTGDTIRIDGGELL